MAVRAGVIGLCVLGAVGTGRAGAATALPSLVGTYKATITNMGGSSHDTLRVMADGRFQFVGITSGKWSETGDKVILRSNGDGGDRFVFRIHQIGENLGSQAREGIVSRSGFLAGVWYAVRSAAGVTVGG
jgi:hypothetical protein